MRTVDAPRGWRTEVDGRGLWAHRSGTAGPTVLVLPGAGGLGLDHLGVQERVAAFATCVVYDRAGTGWSDPVDLPRSAAAAADEARDLLRALGAVPPYVLVGHSLGGAHARRFAHRYPAEVAGLVLIDPLHEDWDLHLPAELHLERSRIPADELPEFTDEMLAAVRANLASMMTGLPADVRDALVARHTDVNQLRNSIRDGDNVADLVDELRAGTDPEIPTIVLASTEIDAGQAMFAPAEMLERQIAGQHRLYRAYTGAAPHRELRPVPGTAHSSLPFLAPGAVADAVRDVAARSPAVA